MSDEQEGNWQLILHRLDSLANNQKEVNSKLDSMNEKLVIVDNLKHTVKDIREWKEKFQLELSLNDLLEFKEWKEELQATITIKQISTMMKEHEKLKTFKTQALMIWVIVQAIMVILLFWTRVAGV